MLLGEYTPGEWLVLVEHELLLFAGIFFLIGALDEFAVDIAWLWLRLTGRAKTPTIPEPEKGFSELGGPCAVLIPAWQEAQVIGTTLSHAFRAWPQRALRIYVGCYRNDPATAEAVIAAADGDPRLRLVIHDRAGPSTKADCLNRLYAALCDDERRAGRRFASVVMHDAEDMVDPLALPLLDRALADADLAQIPVLPVPQERSRWIAGHYCEEFAEAHGKAMVVRDAISVGLPSAGVGCAIARAMLDRLAAARGGNMPFSPDSLTEDYELGLGVAELGGRTRFVRARASDGRLIATRACFPARLDHAVRQKTRWVHGIALQGWERLGWKGSPGERWMRMRDRRGPFTALILAIAYLLLALALLGWTASLAGVRVPLELSPLVKALIAVNFASLLWRAAWRYAFTAREYGWAEGLRAILRIPVANIIAIMAGRRAIVAYLRALRGREPQWDKTFHHAHPAAPRESFA